jgi:hypothetical protein
MANPPDRETTRPLPTLGGVEAGNNHAPSADRILSVVVGPANRSRRHERPSWMVVSRRSGNRPPRWAARLQARVGSGSASPPPVAPTVLASALSVVPVWPGGPCVCWPTRRCCQVGRPLVGSIGPNFGGTPGRCRTAPGSPTQAKVQHVPGGSCWWWRLATYRRRGSRTAPSGSRLTDARLRGRSPRFVA